MINENNQPDQTSNPLLGNNTKTDREKEQEKIHHHLTDKNDLISEEDIKNVQPDTTADNVADGEKPAQLTDKEQEEKKGDDNDEPPTISSWNILGS